MGVTGFEGGGPVGRYWLSRCEGFEVKGSQRGVVEELVRDDDPHVTTRLVVRTRGRRRKIVPVARVTTVDPAQRVLIVERPPRPAKPARPAVWRPRGRRAVAAVAGWTAAGGRSVATSARSASHRGAAAVAAGVRYARPWLEAGLLVLAGSLRRLAAEVRASASMLLRSLRWRRSARSVRSVSTSLERVRLPSWSRRRTT